MANDRDGRPQQGLHAGTLGAERGVDSGAFPPIAQYGFLSDCETWALVAPTGCVERLCLPRFADALFVNRARFHASRLGEADE